MKWLSHRPKAPRPSSRTKLTGSVAGRKSAAKSPSRLLKRPSTVSHQASLVVPIKSPRRVCMQQPITQVRMLAWRIPLTDRRLRRNSQAPNVTVLWLTVRLGHLPSTLLPLVSQLKLSRVSTISAPHMVSQNFRHTFARFEQINLPLINLCR